MTKFKRVLSDAEIHDLFALDNDVFRADSDGNFYTQDEHYFVDTVDLFKIGRKLEQAVLAKLAEQEPIAWVHPDDPTRSITQHQKEGAIKDGGAIEKTMCVFSVPAYAHPFQINGLADGALMDEGTKNHDVESSNITKLTISADAKDFERAIGLYIDSLKDWQLVPKEPTENQIDSAMEASLRCRPSIDDETYVMSIVDAYLAAAPKYMGDSNE